MSLTSRIYNLFSTDEAPHLAPVDGHNHPNIDSSLGVRIDHGPIVEKRPGSSHKHVLGKEEEGRPPYLHVREFAVFNCYSAAT